MNLKDILEQIRAVRQENFSAMGREEFDILMDMRLMDEIYYHLKNYHSMVGDVGRPKESPQYRAKEEDRWYEWEDPLRRNAQEEINRARQEKEKAKREAKEKAQREYNTAWEQAYKANEEVKDRFRRSSFGRFDDFFKQHYENPFHRSGWTDYGNHAGGRSEGSYRPPSPKSEKPWWEVLGTRATATKPEILKAYRSLAMRYHPDRKPDGNLQKMQEINVAKEQALGGK